ncbi:hypothetical protein OH492_16645 [Vibrio chagasii]|nr:hypothetical protein [Vibrio chagasii]
MCVSLWNRTRSCLYVRATAGHHKFYTSGISTAFKPSTKLQSNPEAMFNLKGAIPLR